MNEHELSDWQGMQRDFIDAQIQAQIERMEQQINESLTDNHNQAQ